MNIYYVYEKKRLWNCTIMKKCTMNVNNYENKHYEYLQYVLIKKVLVIFTLITKNTLWIFAVMKIYNYENTP